MSRPSSDQILRMLVARSDLSPEQVQTAALDVMHFVVTSLDAGASFGVKWGKRRGSSAARYVPVAFVIPGVTTEHPEA